MDMTDRGSSVSIGALIQYTLFAAIAYILAGAPYLDALLSTFNISSTTNNSSILTSKPQHIQLNNAFTSKESKTVNLDSLWTPPEDLQCSGEHGHGYRTYVFSREPLVVYVEGFLSEWERVEILKMRCVLFFLFQPLPFRLVCIYITLPVLLRKA